MDSITLALGRTRVTVSPRHGGCIAQIEILDGDAWLPLLIDPPVRANEADPLSWGSFAMLPWPNRIAGGRFTFEGAAYELPVESGGHALHGVGFARAWSVDEVTASSCALSLKVDDPQAWPWPMSARQTIEAFYDGLRQTIEIAGERGARFPAGCGWHPWFRRGVRRAADAEVLIDAAERYELRNMIPSGRLSLVAGAHDLRMAPLLGDRRLDDCYRTRGGASSIAWADLEVTMKSSPNVTHVVVYTPEHAICIEPQTCAIDAFNLDERGIDAGVVVVEPGRPLVARTEWRWRKRDAS